MICKMLIRTNYCLSWIYMIFMLRMRGMSTKNIKIQEEIYGKRIG